MKVKVLHHDVEEHLPSRPGDVQRFPTNPTPRIHKFERAVEYTRALNAAKLEKIFSKPFVGALDGHTDSIKCMALGKGKLADLHTGSCDGEIRLWHTGRKECVRAIKAHDGFVRGMAVDSTDTSLFSVGDDKQIKQWRVLPNVLLEDLSSSNLHGDSSGNNVHSGGGRYYGYGGGGDDGSSDSSDDGGEGGNDADRPKALERRGRREDVAKTGGGMKDKRKKKSAAPAVADQATQPQSSSSSRRNRFDPIGLNVDGGNLVGLSSTDASQALRHIKVRGGGEGRRGGETNKQTNKQVDI
eukprot:GHVU01038633.1.p1 GENE.GHVU01038633.1~~GHVU01038633.1.p1  ORF type:complete len:298 (+),score=68.37 GHVU01038633.1:1557-2450(+)